MRVPLSWLREYVDLPAEVPARELAAKLVAAGLEVETVEESGAGLSGPLVVGEVLAFEVLEGFKKPIRYCRVDVGKANGSGEPQNIICGAANFEAGDRVVVALPGTVLPGGFAIGARKTYGKMSEGMICSVAELGMGEDHSGILVLPQGTPAQPGDDAVPLLGLDDHVLDIAVTPDRGYALSIRGVAREAATAYGLPFRDPAAIEAPDTAEGSWPAAVEGEGICHRYVLRGVTGFDPAAPTPVWMRRRLELAGMRSISLAVDITNYVMLELGQPLHAWDRTTLRGPLVVRLAREGERLETLDHVERRLDPDDILITDDSGPINIAGVMGGLTTEIGDTSTDILIEAAHFAETHIARTARRHRLNSEASRRFERGVDSALQLAAATRAVELLAELGGARIDPGVTHVRRERPAPAIELRLDHPGKVAGIDYPHGAVLEALRDIGATVRAGGRVLDLSEPYTVETGTDTVTVEPPTWRPDLTEPNDLAEEVIRLEGYESIPARAPQAPAGHGLTRAQRLRRRVGRALAADGYTEVLNFPFTAARAYDDLRLPDDDPRRRTLRLVNPFSDDTPLLRTTLLPGLLDALARNAGRGFPDAALYETGLVYLRGEGGFAPPPRLSVDRGPSPEELAELAASIPEQPRRVAVALSGQREPAGWWGPAQPAGWADAIEAARTVVREAGLELTAEAARHAPWHPGRCAALHLTAPDGERILIGHAGELHPRVVAAYGLPERTAAMEIDLDPVERLAQEPTAPGVSTFPAAYQDVALVVPAATPAQDVQDALRAGAGELLESLRLFDVYQGDQIGADRKSLAYALRFRAPDRTLTTDEITTARDAAVTAATERTGAVLRGA
ncbi:phenylalanine--tRNA ligase subunit beta [Allonocardiopsis opalescens]|uniref:Phenylalanine--tRNA ligase beta subunit n=1 Tax=Allonocardiopsis opalescens TaxID=1144618 RepID=A0A2T0PWV5_9ACTN|nr:phenylalanine--tRNA ligase subunit beta [Allonocardiopsis opalescens]PRX96015.1 phenylalanyl-tRNA synthetase beta subunit [Allonocardiopsis opalescens]